MSKIKRSLAIVIGINEYTHIPKLKNAVSDAVELAEVLKDIYGYEVLLLLNQRATKAELDKLVANLQNKTIQFDNKKIKIDQSDRVLFYFAGHGFAEEAHENEAGKPAGYFIPQDAREKDKNTWLSMKEVYEAFSTLDCHHLLMILDCCFAGRISWIGQGRNAARSRKMYRQSYDRFIKHKTEQIITSAAHDEEAQDLSRFGQRGEQNGHSPFAHLLLKVLKYNPEKEREKDLFIEGILEDKVITLHELFVYLQNKLGESAKDQTPGLSQPRKFDRDTGEYVYLKGEYIFPLPEFEEKNLEILELDRNSNPYKSLASFDTEDSDLFFGRTTLSKELEEKVTQQPLTIVLGASGSGKSSLVKAGLIPTLKVESERWQFLNPIRPGESPFKALNKILSPSESGSSVISRPPQEKINILSGKISYLITRNSKSKLLLVIDQSEELFTLCKSQQERENFLNLLAELVTKYPQQLRIVLTLRSDFEPQLRDVIEETYWQKAWQEGRFFVTPMNREELQQAIEEPAAQRTLFFESPKLVNQLIDEVIDTPGALPLLSFTLSQLYLKYLQAEENREQDDRTITEADYEQLGGVARSLTQTADNTYKEVKNENVKESTIRNVMLRMVAISSRELARRRVPMKELEYPEPINEQVKIIIDRFVEARLLVKGLDAEGQEYVEPVHDALVTGWTKINYWLDEKQEKIEKESRSNPIKKWLNAGREKVPRLLKKKENSNKNDASETEQISNKVNIPLQREVTAAAFKWNEVEVNQKTKFLWNASPYLDVLKQVLESKQNNWFNRIETEFVECSIKRRQRNIRRRWQITSIVMAGLSGLTIWALVNLRNAQIQEISALVEASDGNVISQFGSRRIDGITAAIEAKEKFDRIWFGNDEFRTLVELTLLNAVHNVAILNTISGHEDVVRSVSFSPDGKILASASDDRTVKLWNVETNKEETIMGHTNGVNKVSFHPKNSRILASASKDNTVKLWDVETGRETYTFDKHKGEVEDISFSPDGEMLASASSDNTVKLWERKSGKEIYTFDAHQGRVYGVSFSPNGKILASASNDKTVKLWDVVTGEEIDTLTGHTSYVSSVSFSPDGKMLASADSHGRVIIWNTQTRKPVNIIKQIEDIWSVSFSPDSQTLAYAGSDRKVRLLDTKTWKESGVLDHASTVYGISFSPDKDSKILASTSSNKTVQLWSTSTRKRIKIFAGHTYNLWRVRFSSNGKLLASADHDGIVKVWDAVTLDKVHTFKHKKHIHDVSFSRDGKTLASAGLDKKIKLWNIITGEEIDTLDGHEGDIRAVRFSPDGKMLASASQDGTIRLWDTSTGEEIDKVMEQGNSESVYDVSFSPDNKILASAHSDTTVKLWDVSTGKKIAKRLAHLYGHKAGVHSVNFSPDGKMLASASSDSTVKLWDVRTRKEIDTLNGHTAAVLDVSFGLDSKMLASASSDSTIKLWDVGTKKELKTITGHTGKVQSLSFSPNQKIKMLVSASTDATVRWWSFDLDYLVSKGCDFVSEYLRTNPNVGESDRTLCDGVPKPKQVTSQVVTTSTSDSFTVNPSTTDLSTANTPTPTLKPSNSDLKAIALDYHSRNNEPANSQYIENFSNIIAKSSSDAQKADIYVNRGVNYYRQKNYDNAIEDYTEAIKLAPNNIAAYINRGIVYTFIKEPEKAIADYNKAIAIAPENIDAYINRGIAYSSLGNLQKAISDYDQAIAINPNNADAYYAKGLTLAVQEESKQQAIEAYQKAAALYQQQGKNEDSQNAQNKIKELE